MPELCVMVGAECHYQVYEFLLFIKNKFHVSKTLSSSAEYNITKNIIFSFLTYNYSYSQNDVPSVTPTIKVVVHVLSSREGRAKTQPPVSPSVSLDNLVEREGLYTPKQREGRKREAARGLHGLALSAGTHAHRLLAGYGGFGYVTVAVSWQDV
jgi:hypothetical protein